MEPNSKRPVVYVVDDEPIVLKLLQAILTRGGFEVSGLTSAEAAIPQLERSLPDLLLTDLSMPGLSGVELVQRVRELPGGEALPIVIASAHFINGYSQEFLERTRADLLMAKPFPSMAALADTLRALLRERALTPARRPDPAAVAAPQPVAAPRDRLSRAQLTSQRIRREAELLGDDDHTVLGLPHGSGPNVIEAAYRRQYRRYASLVQERGLSAEDQALAQSILSRIELAYWRLAEGSPAPND